MTPVVNDMGTLLTISIGFDPTLITLGSLRIAWHGVFTALGIVAALTLIARFARQRQLDPDAVYRVAWWSIPAGIAGARLLYVIEHVDDFAANWGRVLALNEGGISVYGAIVGGAAVGFLYAWRSRLPVRQIADAAALGLPIGLAVGRIGDLINGEHWAKASTLPWAVCYTNPNTLNGDPTTNAVASCGSLSHSPLQPPAVHPVAGLYEPLLLLVVFAILWVGFRRLAVPGVLFWVFVILYAALRFALAPLRLNETKVGAVSVPQLVAVASVLVAAAMLAVLWRRQPKALEVT